MVISFDDSDPLVAHEALQAITSEMINHISEHLQVNVELLQPASLPKEPSFPDRPVAAGSGLSIGLVCAIGLGIWRYFRGSFPWEAAKAGLRNDSWR